LSRLNKALIWAYKPTYRSKMKLINRFSYRNLIKFKLIKSIWQVSCLPPVVFSFMYILICFAHQKESKQVINNLAILSCNQFTCVTKHKKNWKEKNMKTFAFKLSLFIAIASLAVCFEDEIMDLPPMPQIQTKGDFDLLLALLPIYGNIKLKSMLNARTLNEVKVSFML